MKFEEIKDRNEKNFKPVKILLTIENKEDLYNIYQRLFISDNEICDNDNNIFDNNTPFFESESINDDFYNFINTIIHKKKIRGEL